MKLKSLLTKLTPGKKKKISLEASLEEPPPKKEISFTRRETRIESAEPVGEIDVMVNGEKINIHTLAPETKIGRDPSQADIIISELVVSKLHCLIRSEGDKFFIKDNHSTNGIYINNQKVNEQEIKDGDVILLGKKGSIKLTFHIRR